MKKLFVIAFVSAIATASCSKKEQVLPDTLEDALALVDSCFANFKDTNHA